MVFDSYPKAVNFLIFPLECVRLGFYSSREMEEKVPPHLSGCTGLLSDPTAHPASLTTSLLVPSVLSLL